MYFQLYDSQLIYNSTKDLPSKGNIRTTVFTNMSYDKRSEIIIQVIFQHWRQERDCIFTMIETMLTYYTPTTTKNGDSPKIGKNVEQSELLIQSIHGWISKIILSELGQAKKKSTFVQFQNTQSYRRSTASQGFGQWEGWGLTGKDSKKLSGMVEKFYNLIIKRVTENLYLSKLTTLNI